MTEERWAVFAGEGNLAGRITEWMSQERAERVRDNYEEGWEGVDHLPYEMRSSERSITDALEDARHELVTLNDLMAYDGEAPADTWELDTTEAVARIDEALERIQDLESRG